MESTEPKAPFAALGGRLREAIQASHFRSARGFAEALADQGVRGASYGMVRHYTSGAAQPSLDFLGAAADALRVRREWLAWGLGPRTVAQQPGEGDAARIVGAVAAEFPAFAGVEGWQADAVVQTVARAVGGSAWASDPERAGRAVGKALAGAVRAFGLRAGRMDGDQLAGIIGASLPLLGVLAAEAARRD